MRKLIDYMMTHPLFAGIAGIMVAIFSIKCCNTAGDSLSEGILRMLLVGTMAFFLYFVGEGTRADWQRFHTQYHVAWALILMNIGLQ